MTGRARRDYFAKRGISMRVPAGPVIRRVRTLSRRGMAITRIAEESGLSVPTIHSLLRGYRCEAGGTRDVINVHVDTRNAVMRVPFVEPGFGGPEGREGAQLDPTGTQRRIAALMSAGFGMAWQSREVGARTWLATDVMKQRYVHASTARRFAELYDKYRDTDPAEVGIRAATSTLVKRTAASLGYAPAHCWDDDTIDDPDALPDWTGQCGSPFGWIIHEREGTPVCPACKVSRQEFVLDGDALRRMRHKLGVSQGVFADRAGITVHLYRSWERGRTQPRYLTDLDKVLKVLDTTYEEVHKWPES